MFAHVDINNCYVSCQRLFRPELNHVPVAVLSNNDGCVIARSNETKAMGIKMGDPEFMVRKQLCDHGAAIFSSNYALYADMSARMMNNLSRYTPLLEVYSIDECFLDLSSFKPADIDGHVRKLHEEIVRFTGLPITLGAGRTKSLAKMANRHAKMTKQALTVFHNESMVRKIIYDIPIEELWGVGMSYFKKLSDTGVTNAGQFRELHPDRVRKDMTVQGLRLWKELWGEPCHAILWQAERSKAVCSSKSFRKYVNEIRYLEEAIATYAATVAFKLRRQGSMALTLNVFLRTNKHRIDHDQHYPSITLKLPFAANNTQDLTRAALRGLRAIWEPGHKYLKGGVIAAGIIPAGKVQCNLFNEYKGANCDSLSGVMDRVNQRYGRGMLRIAAEGMEKPWIMKQDMLSPNYTTRWTDIIRTR